MTHLELISLINRHKKSIDLAYNGEIPHNIDPELFEAEIFNKIGNRVVLNRAYIEFVDTMLKRVEYGVIFGNYTQELQQLVNYKIRYSETKDITYLNRIVKGIEDIYLKFKRRDSDISRLIAKIVHENRLSLEVILKDAEDILSQIEEISDASTKTYKILSKEIIGIDKEIDELIFDIQIDMQQYSENLHRYILRLNGFILRTKKRKRQNNKIASLAQKILANEDEELEAMLRSFYKNAHHTFGNKKRYKIKTIPRLQDMYDKKYKEVFENIFDIEPPKLPKAPSKEYKEPAVEKRVVLNYQRLLNDIKASKPNDIFEYILTHSEIKKFDKDRLQEAFKAFLLIVLEHKENIEITEEFGANNIRRIRWI